PHEVDGEALDPLVALAHPEAGRAAVHRVLAQLAAGEGGHALGPFIEYAVEHPHRVVAARNVLLQHQVGRGAVFPLEVAGQQRLGRRTIARRSVRNSLTTTGNRASARNRSTSSRERGNTVRGVGTPNRVAS